MSDQRTVLVAGATGSIGGGIVKALAKRGARVVALGRNCDKLDALSDDVRRLVAATPSRNEDISTLLIDLSDMDSVRRASAEALERFQSVDALVLSSAAFLEGGPTVLPSGHEAMFATNVLGPYLLTRLLLPRLLESNGMILHVIATFNAVLDWNDLESIKAHSTMRAFSRSKTCHRAIAGELARRYTGQMASVAFDPGFITSDPGVEKKWPGGLMGFAMRTMSFLFAKRPAVAGEPAAELLLSDADKCSLNGALYNQGKRMPDPNPTMLDEALGSRLWDELERLTEMASAEG